MSDFYKVLQKKQLRLDLFGQICSIPASYTLTRPLAMRIGYLKEGQDISQLPLTVSPIRPQDIGKPTEAEQVEFHKRMPLPEINLRPNEDFLLNKVKRRPAILLSKGGKDYKKLADHLSGSRRKPVNPNHYLFAPIYSLRKEENISQDYSDKFIEMVKNFELPQFLYLPEFKSPIYNESMVVLEDIFTVGINAIEQTELCLAPEVLIDALDRFHQYLELQIFEQAEELEWI